MRQALKMAILMAASAIICGTADAQKERKLIRESYKLYNDSNYAGAQEASAKAMAEAPESYEAAYNYADALFKQEKVDEAQQQFEKLAANETDKGRLSKLYHNIGNCHYVKKEYDKSIDAYKKSLRADPTNNATRYNLVAAQKMKDKKDDNQNQDKQDQDKQQQDQQQQQQQQQDQKQDQQQQNQQQQQQDQMNKEEAERLLQAVQQDENELQEKRKQLKDAERRHIEKNW